MTQPMLILKLTDLDRWDKLTLIISNSVADDEGNIIPSSATMLLHLDGEEAKEIFYDLALIVHDAYNDDTIASIEIRDKVYKLSRPYREALYTVLFRWVQAITLAMNEEQRWNEHL